MFFFPSVRAFPEKSNRVAWRKMAPAASLSPPSQNAAPVARKDPPILEEFSPVEMKLPTKKDPRICEVDPVQVFTQDILNISFLLIILRDVGEASSTDIGCKRFRGSSPKAPPIIYCWLDAFPLFIVVSSIWKLRVFFWSLIVPKESADVARAVDKGGYNVFLYWNRW